VSEPEWVYRQRRQRAAVAAAMVIGAIAMLIVFGSSVSDGFDLDGRSPVAIDKPDVDEILEREKRQIEAEKQRKLERREARAEHRQRPKKPRKPKKDKEKPRSVPDSGTAAGTPAPASTPVPSSPPPAPAPAPAAEDPATAQAPAAPQPSAPASDGPVDPRFY
jgi:hypothetical protein